MFTSFHIISFLSLHIRVSLRDKKIIFQEDTKIIIQKQLCVWPLLTLPECPSKSSSPSSCTFSDTPRPFSRPDSCLKGFNQNGKGIMYKKIKKLVCSYDKPKRSNLLKRAAGAINKTQTVTANQLLLLHLNPPCLIPAGGVARSGVIHALSGRRRGCAVRRRRRCAVRRGRGSVGRGGARRGRAVGYVSSGRCPLLGRSAAWCTPGARCAAGS